VINDIQPALALQVNSHISTAAKSKQASLNTLKTCLVVFFKASESMEPNQDLTNFARESLEMFINVVKYLDCCTLSLEIIVDVFVEPALANKHWIFNKLFFEDTPENKNLINVLLKGISSPTIHAPSYNHKTRNAIYRIF
jgi:hypothetical protein